MDQNTLRQTVIEFLNQHRKAVFAINDDDNLPTTSLMLYVIDDAMNVYFGTRKAFRKYKHIHQHPVVSLSVIQEVLDPLRVVDVRGEVKELTPEEQESAYAFFKSKNTSKYYVEGAEDFVMFKLTPHFVRWLDAESGELTIIDVETTQ
jgi:general stress protein 26